MTEIQKIAKRHGLPVIEDNAHGLFSYYQNRALGTLGRFATQSFHDTKNVTCGEGGALILNDEKDIERAEVMREKGTNRRRFLRGQVDKYTWVDVGSSFLPSEINAAILLAQLEQRDKIQKLRHQVWQSYMSGLAEWCRDHDVGMPAVPKDCAHSAHMFYIVAPNLEFRSKLMAHLKEKGVGTAFHYQSLHLSDMGRRFGGRDGDCPVTEKMSDCLLRLPMWNGLTESDVKTVIASVQSF
jgi:dTDP-4-amino-4,6-dideoxygalactose transaminase